MKNQLAKLAAFSNGLDEFVHDTECLLSWDNPIFLDRANEFTQHAYELILKGELPKEFLIELVDMQKQLFKAVNKLNRSSILTRQL